MSFQLRKCRNLLSAAVTLTAVTALTGAATAHAATAQAPTPAAAADQSVSTVRTGDGFDVLIGGQARVHLAQPEKSDGVVTAAGPGHVAIIPDHDGSCVEVLGLSDDAGAAFVAAYPDTRDDRRYAAGLLRVALADGSVTPLIASDPAHGQVYADFRLVNGERPLVSFIRRSGPYLCSGRSELGLADLDARTVATYGDINQVYDTRDEFDGRGSCGPTTAVMTMAGYQLKEWGLWVNYGGRHYSPYGRYVTDEYPYNNTIFNRTAPDFSGNGSWMGARAVYDPRWGAGWEDMRDQVYDTAYLRPVQLWGN
ncbi:hypothetical protein ACIA8R_32535 [Nonomuraea sp. NPDC051191]|uniref:hypothetical protein n=1 Tax=Nonomuraea sp. NPDC051191 TaxID=3364372 RepID=UPI003787AE26